MKASVRLFNTDATLLLSLKNSIETSYHSLEKLLLLLQHRPNEVLAHSPGFIKRMEMKYLSCRILHENKIQYCFVWQCFGRHDL
jgi:hypothetical protein